MAEDSKDEERVALLKRARSLAATIGSASAELAEVVEALKDKKTKRQVELDEFGDPKFIFLAKVALPQEMFLTRGMRKYARDAGYSDVEVEEMYNGSLQKDGFFRYYKSRPDKKNFNWTKTWQDWVRRDAKFKKQTATGTNRFNTARIIK